MAERKAPCAVADPPAGDGFDGKSPAACAADMGGGQASNGDEASPADPAAAAGEGCGCASSKDEAVWFALLSQEALRTLRELHSQQKTQPSASAFDGGASDAASAAPNTSVGNTNGASASGEETCKRGAALEEEDSFSLQKAEGCAEPPSEQQPSAPPAAAGEGAEEGPSSVVGPLTLESLGLYFAWCLVDGLTLVVKAGEKAWRPICEHPQVRAALGGWQSLQQKQLEDEERAAAVASEAQAAVLAEKAALLAAEAAEAVPGRRRRVQTEKAAVQVALRVVTDAAQQRLPFDCVAEEFKYLAPDGKWRVFDAEEGVWRTRKEYDFLLATEGAGAGGRSSAEEDRIFAAVATAALKEGEAAAVQDSGEGSTFSPPEGEASPETEANANANAQQTPAGMAASAAVCSGASPEEDASMARRRENAERRRAYRERRKRRREEGQFIAAKTKTNIYVDGLPRHFKEADVAELFRKAGVFKVDPETLLPKIKLYTDEKGTFKGDALVCFAHEASVDVALRFYDGYQVDEEHILRRYEVGDPFYEDLRQEVLEEVSKICAVEKVTVIARHPQGVVCIKVKEAEDGDMLIEEERGFTPSSEADSNAQRNTPASAEAVDDEARLEEFGVRVAAAALSREKPRLVKFKKRVCTSRHCLRLRNFRLQGWVDAQSSDEEFEVQTEE